MHTLIALFFVATLAAFPGNHPPEVLLEKNQKILFLGDSITQNGKYVAYFDAWLVRRYPERRFTVINAGLSSETTSGLSEEGHANGKFPRPYLHERLGRVLEKTQPDLIIACYGMNCGIQKPFDEERFNRFKDGILRLREAAAECGAAIVHVTPPIFDNHGKPGFDYDMVLAAYANWLVEQREQGWFVADLHTEMRATIDALKAEKPNFTVQRDRVHPNAQGHWMIARALIRYFGDPDSSELSGPNKLIEQDKLKAIEKRMRAYLRAIHAETKPLRPNTPMGGTLESAAATAAALEDSIYD